MLGEIQIGIATGRTGIDVEIIRAKNLVVKPGVKVNPGIDYLCHTIKQFICISLLNLKKEFVLYRLS